MDSQIMSKEAAEAYREKFRRDTEPCGEKRFQHWLTKEAKEQHMEEVKQLQESGQVPF